MTFYINTNCYGTLLQSVVVLVVVCQRAESSFKLARHVNAGDWCRRRECGLDTHNRILNTRGDTTDK